MADIKKRISSYLDRPGRSFAFILMIAIGVLLSYFAYYNEINEGGPDGQWHYYFSRYAFRFPKFFLHHWGKPIFILLSSPFSHFGFYALNIFNIICGLLTAFIAYKWSRKLNFGYDYIAIILVLFAPIYFLVMQSALTEPLFSLLLILSAYLLFSEKYFWGVIVTSFLIYSRTEGLLILPIFAVYIIIAKQFKYLPFFLTAFIIYSFIGFFFGHDFLWFFTENPYGVISNYGHGTWTHFFDIYEIIFGTPFVILLIIGFLIMCRKIIVNKEYLFLKKTGVNFKVFYLAFIPSIIFFAFHVYAWGAGKFASAGLERVMASIIPLCVIVCMYFFDLVYKLRFDLIRYLILIFCLIPFIQATFKIYKYPLKSYGGEKVNREMAQWFKTYRKPNSIIYYAHPAIIFHCDFDPFSKDNVECFTFPDPCGPATGEKFYYFWDSQYSQSSCAKSLEYFERCPGMVKVKEINDGDYYKLVVFESK